MTHHLQREMIHRVAVHGLRIHSGYFTAYGYSTELSSWTNSRPRGMVTLPRRCSARITPPSASWGLLAKYFMAAILTKREGGVQSPGMPSRPLPEPIGDKTEAPTRIGPADMALRLTKLRKLVS